MSQFRVFMTRTVTITEHAVIKVSASSEDWAKREALGAPNVEWSEDCRISTSREMLAVTKLD